MEETKKLLVDWGMEELVEVFVDNDITSDMFNDLNENLLKELIPKIGTRIKFMRQLKLLNADFLKPTSSKNDLHYEDSVFSPAASSSTITNDSTYDLSSNTSLDDLENLSTLTGGSQDDTNTGQPSSNDIIILNVDSKNNLVAVPSQNKGKVTYLKDLISSSNEGKSILEVYDKSTFQRAHRQQLANIIIRNELEGQPDNRISSARMCELAEMIVELFPTEYKEVYFVKDTIIKNGKHQKVGKGKLFSKYYSLRRSFINSGLIKKPAATTATEAIISIEESDDQQQDTILWLKNCLEPWTSVEASWKKTFKLRQNQLMHPGKLCHYFNTFPCLRNKKGYLLLEIDFNIAYPDHAMKLFNSWEWITGRIIEYAKTVSKDSSVKKLVENLEGDISSDSVVNHLMVLLTYILPTVSIRKGKLSGRWRPSRIEVLEGFWLHLKNISELTQSTESKKNKLERFGLTLQPLVIVVGPSLSETECIYVKIDENLYQMESSLKALDICFKSIHSLHAEYAHEAEQVWLFIQKAFYNLSTKWDKSFVGVNSLLSDLKL